uniref:Uncharacterized protein n=1 Tax=Pristionchus pacificus TaxID=54126 RepID=A0A2A6BKI5_PRIPA|eukprot:PDM66336.1 hypothetical protein PRIPAC_47753 [Pristionchus pacificus]
MTKRFADMSPTSLRDELESDAVPDVNALIQGIGKYLGSLSDGDKTSPLALLLGTCASVLSDLKLRSTSSTDDAIVLSDLKLRSTSSIDDAIERETRAISRGPGAP